MKPRQIHKRSVHELNVIIKKNSKYPHEATTVVSRLQAQNKNIL